MKKTSTILNYFPRHIFWDTTPEKINVANHKEYIIEKVMLSCANETNFNKSIKILENLYSKNITKDVILKF
ncbi:MAG: hypothetical protein L3J06_00940 [Cyclobacteriaceae bacterium]|nr:hypothetical protein [Cyclobacteriaceae bacterium]